MAAADNAQAQPDQAAQAPVNIQPPVQQPVRTQTPALTTANQQAPATQAPGPTQANNNQNNVSRNAGEQTGLSFARTTTAPAINPDLNAAYDSYQQGDFDTAARLYRQVLMSEPNNHDAMMHLATVYLKQGNPAMAQNLYARLLELNPRDPLARAGLLETIQGDPLRQEAELKSLITAFPGTAQLSFALGNLYATQNRWNEAQSAYFDALLAAKTGNTGPVNPDYAFNLAISLERINQLPTALDYYREAETLSRNSSPGFDPALLAQRLNYLEQRLR
jgi:tetratricopeptide (TPR) repeat protein